MRKEGWRRGRRGEGEDERGNLQGQGSSEPRLRGGQEVATEDEEPIEDA
jgi:hypothetical protein